MPYNFRSAFGASERMVPHAAIYNGDGAGDIPGAGRDEEGGHVCYVLRLAEIAEGYFAGCKVGAFVAGEEAADVFGVDEAGLEAVDGDAVWPQLCR